MAYFYINKKVSNITLSKIWSILSFQKRWHYFYLFQALTDKQYHYIKKKIRSFAVYN